MRDPASAAPAAAFLQRLETDAAQLSAVDTCVRIRLEACDGLLVACNQQPVRDTAAIARGPSRPARPRASSAAAKLTKGKPAIETAGDRCCDLERAQPDAHRIARLQVQRIEQRRIGPYGAGRRNRGRLLRGGRADREISTARATDSRATRPSRPRGATAPRRSPARRGGRDHAPGRWRSSQYAQAERAGLLVERRIDGAIPPARRNRRRASGARRAQAGAAGRRGSRRSSAPRPRAPVQGRAASARPRASRARVMRAAWRNRSRRPKRPACAFTSWPGCPAGGCAACCRPFNRASPIGVEPRHHVVRHPAKAARDTAPWARGATRTPR